MQTWYARMIHLLARYQQRPDEASKLARTLEQELGALWTFIVEEGVELTNNRAERAHPTPTAHVLTISNSPGPLGGDKRFALKLIHHYPVIENVEPRGPWKVRTVTYYYRLEEASEQGKEIFAFHWHPHG